MSRKITVAEHEAWKHSLLAEKDFDEIDAAASDPIHDHTPQVRAKHQVNGVLRILDQLAKENSNREANQR